MFIKIEILNMIFFTKPIHPTKSNVIAYHLTKKPMLCDQPLLNHFSNFTLQTAPIHAHQFTLTMLVLIATLADWNILFKTHIFGTCRNAYFRFTGFFLPCCSWKPRVSLCCGKYKVAVRWFYRQPDSVRMDVGDRKLGYHCHLIDLEVPRPESMPVCPKHTSHLT